MNNRDKMLLTNKVQKEYYETEEEEQYNKKEYNAITGLWMKLRNRLIQFRLGTGIEEYVMNLQKEWLGELKDKKVLDFGCFDGNPLSIYLAENSKSYLGIDLSETAINRLSIKLEGIEKAEAASVDILSSEFQQKYQSHFDIIYAKSVIHHFKYFDELLESLDHILKPGGIIVTFDPMNTYLPIKLVRKIYRPFQSDRDWEFPLTFHEIGKIKSKFSEVEIQGILGKTKKSFLWLLLGNMEKSSKTFKKLHEYDTQYANQTNSSLKNCLQVLMRIQK